MKNAAILLVAASCAALVATPLAAAVNDVFDVYTVDDLTNACAQATFNSNTIRVHPGVYDLTGMPMSPATRADDGTVTASGTTLTISTDGGSLIGLGERPDDTIIKGGGEADSCRLLSFAKICTVSNLTFTGGYVSGASDSGGVASHRDGVFSATFTDCVFSNNYARNFGGVFDQPKTMTRCRFVNNRAGSGGVLRPIASTSKDPTLVRDCRFEGNAADVEGSAQNGGVSYYGCTWSNCVFVGNRAKRGGVFGPTYGHANIATDCRFEGNAATESGSVAADDALAAATHCTFVGNATSAGGSGMVGTGAELVACTLAANTGMPLVVAATLRQCVVRGNVGNRANSNPLFSGCAFYSSLIAENLGGAHSMSQICSGTGGALYNCTVVSNAYQAANYSVADGDVSVNTIFAANLLVDADGNILQRQDLNAKNLPAALTNCLWTATAGTVPGEAAVGGRLVTEAALRFADAAAGDWSIRRKSVARNAGWSDAAYLEAVGATDLSGQPRVFAGDGAQIDVGAYECNVTPMGLLMLLR